MMTTPSTPRVFYRFSAEIFAHFEEIGGRFIGNAEDDDLTMRHAGSVYVFRWIDTEFPQYDHFKMIERREATPEEMTR